MQKNIWVTIIIVAIVVGSLTFWGGMQYGGNNVRGVIGARNFAANGDFGQRGVGEGMMNGARGGAGAFGGGASGEILSRDNQSVVIKMRDGGSRIVFFATSTAVMKSTAGSLADLKVGESVTVLGSSNSDGSVTAQSIQIRPATFAN